MRPMPSRTAVALDSWNPYWGFAWPGTDATEQVSYRHRKSTSTNIIWLDGHVSGVDYELTVWDMFNDWPQDTVLE